jgi:hypothetical protein
MGKLIPSDLEQCAFLNKVYGAARRDPEAAQCLKSNGLPVPKRFPPIDTHRLPEGSVQFENYFRFANSAALGAG